MSSFQFKYSSARAEDIVNGSDPVVFAGATTLRGISLPLLTSAKNSSKKAYLSIRPEKTIESQFQIHKQFENNEQISDLKSQFSKTEKQSSTSNDNLVMEALSRGFSIRRQRDDVVSHNTNKKRENAEAKKSVGVDVPSDLQCHILLTPSEIARLQTGIAANYHQSQSRTESKTLYEKFMERLALQRVNFVNGMIESERNKSDKKNSATQGLK